MNDHVTKPIEPDVLYQTLARWFRRRPAAETPVAREQRPRRGRSGAARRFAGVDTAIRPEARRRQPGALPQPAAASSSEGQAGAADAIRKALRDGRPRARRARRAHAEGRVGQHRRRGACRRPQAEVERAIRDGAAADALIARAGGELSGVVGRCATRCGDGAGAAAAEAPAARCRGCAARAAEARSLPRGFGRRDGRLPGSARAGAARRARGRPLRAASARRSRTTISETRSTGCGGAAATTTGDSHGRRARFHREADRS